MRPPVALLCASLGVAGFLIGSRLPPPSAAPSLQPARQNVEPPQHPTGPDPAPGGRAVTADSFADLDSLLRRGDASPADSRLQLMEAINSLKTNQLEQMLETEIRSDLFLRSDRFDFQYAASRFAEIAPERAAKLWASHAEARSFSGVLISSWAKKDPVAFASWTLTQTPEIQRAARGSLIQAASSDPAFFASIAHQLASSPNGTETARAAMRSLAGKEPGSAQKQLEYAALLPEGPMRNAALSELAQAAPNLDLKAHPEVLQALASLPARDAYKLGSNLAQKVDSLPPGPVREAAMLAALREQARTDPAAAAQRLEALPPNSPDYAAAVRGFVDSTSAKDPASAAEWALSIPPAASSHRSGALERVAKEYFRTNPDGASEWVEKAPLTNEEYRRLTGRTRPNSKP